MKRLLSRGLFQRAPIRRQLVILLSVLSLSSVALGFVLVILDDLAAYEDYESKLGSYLTRLAADFSLAPLLFEDDEGAVERLAYLETIPGVMSATVTTADETLFAVWERARPSPGDTGAEGQSEARVFPLWIEEEATLHAAIMHEGERIGEVALSVSYSAFRDTMGDHLIRLAWILAGVLAITLVFAYALQRPISTPIRKLAAATESVALEKGRQVPMPENAAREITELYESFNLMLARIDERERERDAVQEELRQAHDELEARVVQRTLELESANKELLVEIKERAAAERQLTRALGDREILLREIHHRVKNNLNVIYGLLALQTRELDDAAAAAALTDSQQRVKVMATVHETLYESTNVSRIKADEFANRIVSELKEVYAIDHSRIRIETSLDCFILDLEQAIPVGLILNELITNALKHAFPGTRRGVVRVSVSLKEDDSIELCVCDDGIGMENAGGDGEARTLGLRLVEALSRQLDGRVEFTGEQGTKVRVIFTHHVG